MAVAAPVSLGVGVTAASNRLFVEAVLYRYPRYRGARPNISAGYSCVANHALRRDRSVGPSIGIVTSDPVCGGSGS